MVRPCATRSVIVLTTLVGLLASHAIGCSTGCGPSGSIPDGKGADSAPNFIGQPAVANPLAPKNVPQHPLLGEINGAHIDGYNSGVQDVSGPLGINPQVISRSLDFLFGTCGLHAFDAQGRLISGCARLTLGSIIYLYLLDPSDLRVLDAYPLPNTLWGVFGQSAGEQGIFVAGIYYHVDNQGRVIIGNVENMFQVIGVVEVDGAPQWQLLESFDLQPYLPADPALMDTL